MVRGAVLALVALVAAGCSSGPSGSVTLAPTSVASPAPAEATVTATTGRTATVRTVPSPRPSSAATTSSPATTGWYTSAAGNAKYYYCDADHVSIAAKNRRVYASEQALLADWAGKRTKWPQSKC